MHTVKCAECQQEKPATTEYFHCAKGRKHGLAGYCKECAKAKSRAWHAGNKERAKATAERYRTNNGDQIKQRHKAWLERNKNYYLIYMADYRARFGEKINDRYSAWAKKNPEKINAWGRTYRARRKGCGGSHTGQEIQNLLLQQGGKCAGCDEILSRHHVDHIMPIALGGSNDISNLQILCPQCNWQKGAKHPSNWVPKKKQVTGENHGRR